MFKNKNKKEIELGEDARTEFERVRKEYGFTMKQVSEEIGMSEAPYSLYESGKRTYKTQERQEKFLYKIQQACKRLQETMIAASMDLEKNTYKSDREFTDIEESIEDELQQELHYPPITKSIFRKAKRYIQRNKTLVWVAAELGVDERELGRMLKKSGIPFEAGDNPDYLTNENKFPMRFN